MRRWYVGSDDIIRHPVCNTIHIDRERLRYMSNSTNYDAVSVLIEKPNEEYSYVECRAEILAELNGRAT